MTKVQAAAIRLRWEQRAYNIPCEHLTLELERNDRGDATASISVFSAVSLWPNGP
jgi:hypothetical protein